MKEKIKPLKDEIFKKAIFETIRLWCTSEYNYSSEFKKAMNLFNNEEKWISDDNEEFNSFSKLYTNFLSDYSIARTRKADKQIDLIKLIFKSLSEDIKCIDDIAHKIKENKFSSIPETKIEAILPLSLVSKSAFLAFPKKFVLLDNRGKKSLKAIFPKSTINTYMEYFNLFDIFKEDCNEQGKKIISEFLQENNNILSNYYNKYCNYFGMNSKSLEILDDIDFLYHRSLDKYLWYYFELLYPKKP